MRWWSSATHSVHHTETCGEGCIRSSDTNFCVSFGHTSGYRTSRGGANHRGLSMVQNDCHIPSGVRTEVSVVSSETHAAVVILPDRAGRIGDAEFAGHSGAVSDVRAVAGRDRAAHVVAESVALSRAERRISLIPDRILRCGDGDRRRSGHSTANPRHGSGAATGKYRAGKCGVPRPVAALQRYYSSGCTGDVIALPTECRRGWNRRHLE
jgi:hypothetical protein